MTEFLDHAKFIALEAGKMLKENLRRPFTIEFKGAVDLVTEMDRKSEEMITTFLMEKFPSHNVISEEGAKFERKSDYVWYIDPLDGTTNYAHRIPWFAISIGLIKGNEPIVGVVLNPANGEIFTAEAGKGAYFNGDLIRVSSRQNLRESLLSTGFPYYIHDRYERVVRNFSKFLTKARGIRRFGAAALDLAYVAAGIYDGFWEENLKKWDTAAGILLVKEAGGKVTNYAGKNYILGDDTIIASNGIIHDKMLEIVSKEKED